MSMKRLVWTMMWTATGVVLLGTAGPSLAAVIFESATVAQDGSGSDLVGLQYLAVRFHVTSTVTTDTIGGHFFAHTPGDTFFGAIVALTGPTDFPDSGDLSTPDVLGAAIIPVSTSLADYSAPLSLMLVPGDYALVFGSGLFSASGSGGASYNHTTIGTPTYFFYLER